MLHCVCLAHTHDRYLGVQRGNTIEQVARLVQSNTTDHALALRMGLGAALAVTMGIGAFAEHDISHWSALCSSCVSRRPHKQQQAMFCLPPKGEDAMPRPLQQVRTADL